MSDVSEHSDSEFYFPKKKKKKEKRGGHTIKCLLTELGRAGRENIWPSVISHGPRCARSVRHDHGPNIFPSGPPTHKLTQPRRRRRQQKRHKFAYLTVKNNSFARFARAVFFF